MSIVKTRCVPQYLGRFQALPDYLCCDNGTNLCMNCIVDGANCA